ncbi:hypothetical protein ACHAW5_010688 [Stephanodiscus triporus]|uniref:Uncharacterized protein n=1 Tax=Stephanodiscus triporus TaxID=2934178 RepID=A0ABD3QUQ6_9STRA
MHFNIMRTQHESACYLLLEPSQPNRQRQCTMRLHLVRHMHNDQQPLSASIPLPKSHIHRTHSELQLAEDVQRAEKVDVRMCVRLIVGMQSQCITSGYVHPLTEQSMRDILRTKAADEHELEGKLREHHRAAAELLEDDDGWEVSYYDNGKAAEDVSGQSCRPMGTSSRAPISVKTPSNGSVISNSSSEEYPEDDEFVFSLEL